MDEKEFFAAIQKPSDPVLLPPEVVSKVKWQGAVNLWPDPESGTALEYGLMGVYRMGDGTELKPAVRFLIPSTEVTEEMVAYAKADVLRFLWRKIS